MTVEKPAHELAHAARIVIRSALKGALATLDHRDPGRRPYVSLVLLATRPDGAPITLVSGLALHTRNLAADPRASLLIDATAGLDNPMTGARLTLGGRMLPDASGAAAARFLTRHPTAATYAGLPDFRVYALDVEHAHYIGGFGRIVDIAPAALATDIADADDLIAREKPLLESVNTQYADAIAAYATDARGMPGPWKATGVDPDGADLVHRSNGLRIAFPQQVRTAAEAMRAIGDALAPSRSDARGATPG